MAMENDFVNWPDLSSIPCSTSPSTDTSTRSSSSPNSSATGSAGCNDTPQASAPDEIANPTALVLRNDSAVHDGCEEEPKHRCMHPTHPENDRPTFSAFREFKRHWRVHDPKAPLWHCGCCQNLGYRFQPKQRKDKVQSHLGKVHGKPKSESNTGISCPHCCNTLFIAASCLDEHFEQKHSSQPQGMPSQTITGSTCDCQQMAESKRMRKDLQPMTNKHRAPSLLESRAKRERLDAAEYYASSALVPQPGGFDTGAVPRINSLPDMRSTESHFSLSNNNSFSDPVYEIPNLSFFNMAPQWQFTGWNEASSSDDPCYNELAFMNQGINVARDFAPGNVSQIYAQTPPYQLSLGESKLADFLALRKTQDFQNLAIILQTTYDDYLCPPINTITYNPEKEILTLAAYSEMKVKKAMTELRLLVDKFSTRWGRKNLMTSQPSTSRALLLGSSARRSTNPGTARVFPIKPKEDRRLVQVWFKSILPALPNILSERLNGRYSVGLVRRGQSDFRAEPCIQIESPCLPGQKAQVVIKDLVRKVWEKYGHESIPMRFIEGSIKRLSGVGGADDDDGGESAYFHRLDLNYNRPYSKPGMGASLGLWCSDKVSATLGGYVLIGGEKYMLTAEHFVGKARQAADTDDDCVTFTSPSRGNLKKMTNNLVQNKLDIDSQIQSLGSRIYGDRDIPDNDFSDPKNLPLELLDLMGEREVVISLLNQVTRPLIEYAVGTVKSLSIEPRNGSISRSLADDLGLSNDELIIKHQMDWALIRTNSRTANNGENRHKYRSNEDAIQDDLYVDEDGHANQPGEVVYETCSPRSAEAVYYVGQRSKHRSGRVNGPILDGNSRTYAWGILGLDGHEIPEEDVEGDSGAWVIRKEDNKLMGQVHSHAQGQVLFTPIDIIFAELEEICESDVSLPPRPPGSDDIPSTSTARPLCSVRQTPPARAYQFNIPPLTSIPSPKTSPIEIALPKTGSLESLRSVTTSSNTTTTHSQISSDLSCDSSSSFATLADYSLSSATTPEYPKSPQLSENADNADWQANIEKLPSKSPPTIVGESTMSEIPDLSLDEPCEDQPVESEPLTIKFKFQTLFKATSTTRTSTWPVALGMNQVAKARRGSGSAQPQIFRKAAVPYSAHAILDRLARFARRIEDVTDIETISPSEHGDGALPVLENVRRQGYSSMLGVA